MPCSRPDRALCVQPTCRLYVEDVQCCASEGLLTDKSAVLAHLLCTHPVSLPLSCLSVSGPVNTTVRVSYAFDAQVQAASQQA